MWMLVLKHPRLAVWNGAALYTTGCARVGRPRAAPGIGAVRSTSWWISRCAETHPGCPCGWDDLHGCGLLFPELPRPGCRGWPKFGMNCSPGYYSSLRCLRDAHGVETSRGETPCLHPELCSPTPFTRPSSSSFEVSTWKPTSFLTRLQSRLRHDFNLQVYITLTRQVWLLSVTQLNQMSHGSVLQYPVDRLIHTLNNKDFPMFYIIANGICFVLDRRIRLFDGMKLSSGQSTLVFLMTFCRLNNNQWMPYFHL